MHFTKGEGWGSISGTRMLMLTDGEQEAGENEEERSVRGGERERQGTDGGSSRLQQNRDIPTERSSSCGFCFGFCCFDFFQELLSISKPVWFSCL